jgi:ABC-2 type transport system permease protein
VFPLYFLSGALYPLAGIPAAMVVVTTINPLSYAVDGLRDLLIQQSHFGVGTDLVALTLITVALVGFGVWTFGRIEA